MPKPKPLPQTIAAFCGHCGENDAEMILPDATLACKPCAKKQGIEVAWKISNKRLQKIYDQAEARSGVNIPMWKFAALLGIETSTRVSASNYVSALLRDRDVPANIAEEALKLDQLEQKDIIFLLDQITP